MKRFITLCCLALVVMVFQVSVKAQYNPGAPPPPPEASYPNLGRGRFPEVESPMRTMDRPRQEAKVVRKGILAPSESDVIAHQFLLSLKKTGLMRLLPREAYDWELRTVPKRVDMRGGGAFFSFHYRSHEYGFGSDISYARGNLSVGFAGADYGFLTDLGDTPLEPIDEADLRAAYFLNYTPPTKENEARLEARLFRTIKFSPVSGRQDGITVDGVVYGSSVPAHVNHTYLLRSITYNRSDLVVALRVVNLSDDGGLTIAWKILKEFMPPRLIRVPQARDLTKCNPNCK